VLDLLQRCEHVMGIHTFLYKNCFIAMLSGVPDVIQLLGWPPMSGQVDTGMQLLDCCKLHCLKIFLCFCTDLGAGRLDSHSQSVCSEN
jgi:hypothetical protein